MTTQPMDIETFVWDNLNADVYLGLHGRAMHLYLHSVVTPAMRAIDARHNELSRSEDPAAVFELSDLKDLHNSSVEAFVLAIQSLWERQFREFLKGCARELKRSDAFIRSLNNDKWSTLVERFGELRGLPLCSFDSFDELEMLQMLGNACRHGDGTSARLLYDRWPDLWPMWPPSLPESWGGPPLQNVPTHPPFDQISVPAAVLDRLGHAVIWFWEDHNYIRINSIKDKDLNVAKSLRDMREKRAQRPLRQSIAALRTVD